MTETENPAVFFEQFLPEQFARLAGLPPSPPPSLARAVVVARVVDRGEWCLSMDGAQLKVQSGGSDACALQISMSSASFVPLVGELRLGAADMQRNSSVAPRGVWTRLARWNEETAELIRNVPGSVLVRVEDENLTHAVAITPGSQPFSLTNASCTIDCRLQDVRAMQRGETNPLALLSDGNLRLSGEAQVAMGLASLFL